MPTALRVVVILRARLGGRVALVELSKSLIADNRNESLFGGEGEDGTRVGRPRKQSFRLRIRSGGDPRFVGGTHAQPEPTMSPR